MEARELYNLREDIGEQRDVSGAMPERTENMYADWQAWEKDVNASAALFAAP